MVDDMYFVYTHIFIYNQNENIFLCMFQVVFWVSMNYITDLQMDRCQYRSQTETCNLIVVFKLNIDSFFYLEMQWRSQGHCVYIQGAATPYSQKLKTFFNYCSSSFDLVLIYQVLYCNCYYRKNVCKQGYWIKVASF